MPDTGLPRSPFSLAGPAYGNVSSIADNSMASSSQDTDGLSEGPPLLRLPPELHNRIYQAEFEDNKVSVAHDGAKTSSTWFTEAPGLLRCNKQIYTEATPIYYAESTFDTTYDSRTDVDDGVTWLTSLPEGRRLALKEVQIFDVAINVSMSNAHVATRQARDCKELLQAARARLVKHGSGLPPGALQGRILLIADATSVLTHEPMDLVKAKIQSLL